MVRSYTRTDLNREVMEDFTEEEIFGTNIFEFQRSRKMVVGRRVGPAMRW